MTNKRPSSRLNLEFKTQCAIKLGAFDTENN